MEFEWSDIFKENLVRYTINIYELLHSLLSGTVTSEKTEPIRSRRMCRSFAKLETCTSCQTLRPSRRGDLDQGGSRWPTGGAFCILRRKIPGKKERFLLQNLKPFLLIRFFDLMVRQHCNFYCLIHILACNIGWYWTRIGITHFYPRQVWRAFAKAARCWMFQCDTKWNRTWKRGLMINLILSSSSFQVFFWRSSVLRFLLNQQKTLGFLELR